MQNQLQTNEDELQYLHGFGNEFLSESSNFPNALPKRSINPQRLAYDLFAEQLSGSSFTSPRATNKRTWFYRHKPSVLHEPYELVPNEEHGFDFETGIVDVNQRRWKPFDLISSENEKLVDFVHGIKTLAYSDSNTLCQIAIHIYAANHFPDDTCLVNSDGDFLIVPQCGILNITTEFGKMQVGPNEICVIQRGMKFSVVATRESTIKGYILEVIGNHFELPYLGPIGANCLANPRDFQTPVACVDTSLQTPMKVYNKFKHKLFKTVQRNSPFDVAAWFGNYVPYKYDLSKFVAINTVSVDHPDPSIFTVLTSPNPGNFGTAIADLVIFPPRWECAIDTFRPPYYHRNCMTEFMGLIKGQYDAKSSAFAPGGASLHQSMIPHGPDSECYTKTMRADTSKPKRVADDTMAFMFESSLNLLLTQRNKFERFLDNDYHRCWHGL